MPPNFWTCGKFIFLSYNAYPDSPKLVLGGKVCYVQENMAYCMCMHVCFLQCVRIHVYLALPVGCVQICLTGIMCLSVYLCACCWLYICFCLQPQYVSVCVWEV